MSWHNCVRGIGSWDLEQTRTYTPDTYGESRLAVHVVPNYGYAGPSFPLSRDTVGSFGEFLIEEDGLIPGPTYFPASQLFGGRACAVFGVLNGVVDVGAGPTDLYPLLSANIAELMSIEQPFGLAVLGYPGAVDAIFAGGITIANHLGVYAGVTELVSFVDTDIPVNTAGASLWIANVSEDDSSFHVFTRNDNRIRRYTDSTWTLTNPGPLLDLFFGLYFPTTIAKVKLKESLFTESEILRLGRGARSCLWASNIPS